MTNDIYSNGVLVERITDNGDGTGLHQFFDSDGELTESQSLTDLPVMEGTEFLADDATAKAIILATELLRDPERLATLVGAIANSNTAKGPLE